MNLQREESHGQAWSARPVGLGSPRKSEGTGTVYHKQRDGQAVYLNTPQGTRKVGIIATDNGRRVLEKHCIESKHLHRRFDAWGVDAELLVMLAQSGVESIRVLSDKGTVEEAGLQTWKEHGIGHDFGYGRQVFLPRKHFRRTDKAQPSLFGGGK